MPASGDRERIEQEVGELGERNLTERVEGGGCASGRLSDQLDPSGKQRATSWLSWRFTLYVLVVGATCVFLVPLSNLWWLVLLFGALIPLALDAIDRWGTSSRALEKKSQEKELLEALARGGEVTPATVAMRTSLTVGEASKMLEELSRDGHLKFRADEGALVYSLRVQDQQGPSDPGAVPTAPQTKPGGPVSGRLEEPLSGREVEVLSLLASGRTNAEIARDLFVAVGTVKAHINNIYRKLDARNRAEALNRARELKLLG
jgi:DNA-binding NarL/FixJ family response regulator